MRSKRSFSLIELIVVMIVIGILATFAVPAYRNAQRRILDHEATTNLKLIQAAEKTYRIEHREYEDTTNTTDTNEKLGVDLPIGGHWEYTVPVAQVNNSPAVGNPQTFCAQATHVVNAAVSESWHIDQDDPEADDCACGVAGVDCTGR